MQAQILQPNQIKYQLKYYVYYHLNFLFGKEARSNICTLPTNDATFNFAFSSLEVNSNNFSSLFALFVLV